METLFRYFVENTSLEMEKLNGKKGGKYFKMVKEVQLGCGRFHLGIVREPLQFV